MKANKTLDMTTGPFLKKIILFSLPIILSGLLQLFFNAADIAIVGNFSKDGDFAVSAVGCTSSLINGIVALAMGMSNGAGVIVAQNVGAKNSERVKTTVHTAMLISVICGAVVGAIGFFFAKPLLSLMGTPNEVLPLASLYIKIYFMGLPVQMIYNFGSSILRAIGDTTRPLFFLFVSGIINVGLNVFFVSCIDMSVEGVAISTVISQGVSAILVVLYMLKQDNDCRLELKKLAISFKAVKQILYIGIPSGLQGMIFALSNIIMQSTINSFGAYAMSGSAAASSVAGFVFIPMNSIHHASSNFIGQNTGARRLDQVKKLTIMLCSGVAVIGIVLAAVVVGFGRTFIGLFTDNDVSIKYGIIHLAVMCLPYFICGLMDVIVGCIRGMGSSVAPMLVSLAGVCGLRLVWLWGAFPYIKTIFTDPYTQYSLLFISYALSWLVTFLCQLIVYRNTYKKLKKRFK